MSKSQLPSTKSAELRNRAEKRAIDRDPGNDSPPSSAETQRLLHELQVHQIELELQNEELRRSRSEMESALTRYTDLYDFAPVSYFTLAVDGAIREANLPGARLLGTERSRLIGSRFETFVSDATRIVYEAWLKEVFVSGKRQTCELTLGPSKQSLRSVELEAMLSLDGCQARAVVIDITDRKILEAQLLQAQKMEIVGQLAGGIAHDFNNILSAMILSLEILPVQYLLPPESKPALRELEDLAKRASSLTRQLLLFSRRQAMQPAPIELNSALVHLLKMMGRLLGEDITCIRVAKAKDLWIEADIAMIDQAVMNLCLNARDAMPKGGKLTLETSSTDFGPEKPPRNPESRAGRYVCLRITDTGCGMDPDVLEHLFEPFFTTKDYGKGTGLGLASAYGIVRQHQGWMEVESTLGQGTSFCIYLPRIPKTKAIRLAPPEANSPRGRGETLLVVEDEIALREIAVEALTLFGYRALPASDGEEALKLWEQHHGDIDLVLTDMKMPKGLSGLELAEKLWRTKSSLKIIIMSGYSLEMLRDNPVGGVAYTFLAKPFDLRVLAEAVRHCLDKVQ